VSRKGGKMKLLNLPPRIRNLLSVARLLTVFEAYESEDEVVRSF
jgi:anti-sigma B factor antagonist